MSLTTPVIVTRLVTSNMEKEWWPRTGAAAPTTTATTKNRQVHCFMAQYSARPDVFTLALGIPRASGRTPCARSGRPIVLTHSEGGTATPDTRGLAPPPEVTDALAFPVPRGPAACAGRGAGLDRTADAASRNGRLP